MLDPVPARYVCASDVIDASRIGVEYQIGFIPSDANPPTDVYDRTTRFSMDYRRFRTTYRGRHQVASITIDAITEAELPQYREMYDSLARGEVLTIDSRTLLGWPVEVDLASTMDQAPYAYFAHARWKVSIAGIVTAVRDTSSFL